MSDDRIFTPNYREEFPLPDGRRLRLRLGTPADRDFVADLAKRVFSAYGEYDRILPSCLGDPRFHTFVSEQADGPAGFCMLSIGEEGVGEVVAVAVDPLWQGRGIGRQLMRTVMEDARGLGIRLLFLKTGSHNLPAQMLFRKVGFEETGRAAGTYSGGQTAIGMLKRL